jgi:DNA-directed RNA polymerase specialized sigma24 family protein
MPANGQLELTIKRRPELKALSKYVYLRLRSERASLSERSLVWMIDADRALSSMKSADRDVMLARVLGFTVQEIARALHMNQQRAERCIKRGSEHMTQAFLKYQVIGEGVEL